MRRGIGFLLLLLCALLGAMAATSLLVQAPALTAPQSGEFDTKRAAARLQRILGDQRPHTADTPTNDAVRARLIAELRAIGLEPQVRDDFACNDLQKSRGVSCARVRNVIATIGPEVGKHLLLNSHYDSNAASPGAGDAGAGVATMLEVAAILKDEQLQRPVTFLFNEGEELGLIGARAFLAHDPLAARVDSLINLEARGSNGPVVMFETSVPNAAPVRLFASSVERPLANSLTTDAYRQLPNYTDVNSFEERGWLTLNFGFIGNESRYHSPGDRFEALDLRSLQHMGDQTLAVARAMQDGAPQSAGTLLYMDVAGRFLVKLPVELGMALLAGEALILGWLCRRRKSLLRGTTTVFAGLLVGTGLAFAGTFLLGTIRPGDFWRAYPVWTHLAVYACGLAGAVAALGTIGRRLDAAALRAAFWFAFLLIGVAIAFVAPGGIVYFLFPPLALLAGVLVGRWIPRGEAAGALLAGLVAYLTLGAMLGMLEEMLSAGPMWLFAPLGLLVTMPFLIEAKPLLDGLPRLPAIASALALALLGWVLAAAAPAYSQDRQQRFTIEYVRDASAAQTYWAVNNDGAPLPAGFGTGWQREEVPFSERRRWTRDAPAVAVEPPSLEPVGSVETPRGRRVTLRLRPNGALSTAIVVPEDTLLRAAGVPGRLRSIDIDDTDGEYLVRCTGRSCDGMIVQLLIGKDSPVEAKLVGIHPGLPPEAQPLLAARPDHARPQYWPDSVIAMRRVRL